MSIATLSVDEVAHRLRSAIYGPDIVARGFRFWADDALGDVVDVVLTMDHEKWDEFAREAFNRGRRVTTESLRDLPVFAWSICRTVKEHESLKVREQGIWMPVEKNRAC